MCKNIRPKSYNLDNPRIHGYSWISIWGTLFQYLTGSKSGHIWMVEPDLNLLEKYVTDIRKNVNRSNLVRILCMKFKRTHKHQAIYNTSEAFISKKSQDCA